MMAKRADRILRMETGPNRKKVIIRRVRRRTVRTVVRTETTRTVTQAATASKWKRRQAVVYDGCATEDAGKDDKNAALTHRTWQIPPP